MDQAREALDRAIAQSAASRQVIDDLGAIFDTFDSTLAGVDDLGAVASTDVPTLLRKLHALQEGGYGKQVPDRHKHHLDGMLRRFRSVVERNMNLERELRILSQSSNVILSTPLDNVPALTTSTVVTFGTPYSGVKFMICAAELPAELTPAGRFATLNFMGIDFGSPSINPANISYLVNTPGSQGQPLVGGMGMTWAYSNLTAPAGKRTFEPWVGWLFDPSAKISFSVYNPNAGFPGTYLLDWLMRSSPCPQGFSFGEDTVIGHVAHHEVGGLMDAIHHFTVGVGEHNARAAFRPASAAITSGYSMLSNPGHGYARANR